MKSYASLYGRSLLTFFCFFWVQTYSVFPKPKFDPQVELLKRDVEKKALESGYGDIELDNLHRDLKNSLPQVSKLEQSKKDCSNEKGEHDIRKCKIIMLDKEDNQHK